MSSMETFRRFLYSCEIKLEPESFIINAFFYGLALSIGLGLIFYNNELTMLLLISASLFVITQAIAYGSVIVIANSRIQMIEEVLPDFLTLMSGNIRSGLTTERALLLSARKEFGILTKEIDKAAKLMITGVPFTDAFMAMTGKINSEVFAKTVRLIVEGVRSGGNLAELLDNTANDIRKFGAIRKEVSATVLSYQLFMLAAVAIGAPLLYAVSTFLVDAITRIKSKALISAVGASNYFPMFQSTNTVDPQMVFFFAIFSICMSAILGSLAAGVISKGKESDGFTYVPFVILISVSIFLVGRFILETFLGKMLMV